MDVLFTSESTGGKYWWGKDNLLYMEAQSTVSLNQAKDYCAAIPGHRLVIFKTNVQKEILQQFDSSSRMYCTGP